MVPPKVMWMLVYKPYEILVRYIYHKPKNSATAVCQLNAIFGAPSCMGFREVFIGFLWWLYGEKWDLLLSFFSGICFLYSLWGLYIKPIHASFMGCQIFTSDSLMSNMAICHWMFLFPSQNLHFIYTGFSSWPCLITGGYRVFIGGWPYEKAKSGRFGNKFWEFWDMIHVKPLEF